MIPWLEDIFAWIIFILFPLKYYFLDKFYLIKHKNINYVVKLILYSLILAILSSVLILFQDHFKGHFLVRFLFNRSVFFIRIAHTAGWLDVCIVNLCRSVQLQVHLMLFVVDCSLSSDDKHQTWCNECISKASHVGGHLLQSQNMPKHWR